MKRAATILLAVLALTTAGCPAIRMRVDNDRIRKVETIAPITFVGNHFVLPPTGTLADTAGFGEPTDATSAMIFDEGVTTFVKALRETERFKVFLPDQVLDAKTYGQFPFLSGTNASGAQLAEGFRYVTPQDGEKIANLLEEIDADAALITYWRFSLDNAITGQVGVRTANPRAHMRAWLVDREGKIVFDDEIDVPSQESIAIFNDHYDAKTVLPLFQDPITTCAVRFAADLSNARAKARGE